jgi:hypothetical protein
VGFSPIVGMLDVKSVTHFLAVVFNKVGGIPFKAKIYVDGKK